MGSIYLGEFIADMVRVQARTPEDVVREMLDAARAAVIAHYGEATPIEVEFDDGPGSVFVFQVLRVVDVVADPKREVSLLAAKRIDPSMEIGDEPLIPIRYTYAAEDVEYAKEPWADVVPLPIHDTSLWDRLTAALSRAVQKYYPPKPQVEGTLGHLLASGGGWTRGVVGRAGETELEIAGAFLEVSSVSPTMERVKYGFDLVVRTNGEAKPLRIDREDHEGNVRDQLALPTASASRPALEETLAELAAMTADVNGYTWVPSVMIATLKRPAPGSLMEYVGPVLTGALGDFTCRVQLADGAVTFRTFKVFPPEIGLSDFGRAAHRLVAEIDGEPVVDRAEYTGDVLSLGHLSLAALDRPGPQTPDDVRDVQHIVATYREWLGAHLSHLARTAGLDHFRSMNFFYAFPGHFPLMDLIEQRMTLGPPGPVPVPPFTEEALAAAGRALMPVRGASLAELARTLDMPLANESPEGVARSEVFAAYAVHGWRIVLADDCSRPFGIATILVIPPEGGRHATVLTVDAWNPQARTVVDGDPFAFRRFVTWLREAILRGGHDHVIHFEVEADDDEAETATTEMPVSQWLRFGLPDFGDRFLVDWRGQWDIVNSVIRTEDFAGIYGYTREYIEKLRTHDIPLWRRFLREVIDPRFGEQRV